MLLFLNPENSFHRIIRRGIVVGFFTFLSIVIQQVIEGQAGFVVPDIYVPLFTALLAVLDKAMRK